MSAEIAAPFAPILGIKNALLVKLIKTPKKEIIFSVFNRPLAVNNVPNMKFMLIGIKQIIKKQKENTAVV